jgi:hypothetical protein
MESSSKTDLIDADWETIKMLTRTGHLSVSRFPSLLAKAVSAERYLQAGVFYYYCLFITFCFPFINFLLYRWDVLASVIEFVPDLSEKQCVKILGNVLLKSGPKAVVSESLFSSLRTCLILFGHA